MTVGDSSVFDGAIPTQPRQRLGQVLANNIYGLVPSLVISALLLTLAASILSGTATAVRNARELARDGRLVYASDVEPGRRWVVVRYSFVYGGKLYRGEAPLPSRYVSKVRDYMNSGNLPVLFLPADPSINHPNEWHDDESYSHAFLSYLLVAIVIVQWWGWGRFLYSRTHRT
jgi:hypothetical protein